MKLSDYSEYLDCIITAIKAKAKQYSINEPYLVIEPGRSIVGEAGITLYTVGAIKEIAGKNMLR
jgi:diaminopimelate decarboxylase